MKYGLLDFDITVRQYWNKAWNKRALLNIGDAAEYMVIDQLYDEANIPEKDRVYLGIDDLFSYSGEKLIVALNIALDSYVGYNKLLTEISKDIIPIFLGMSFTIPDLDSNQIKALKVFAPIGCRDQRSYDLMAKYNIPAYLNGCTTSILKIEDTSKENLKNKILFIDVPSDIESFIPAAVKENIFFLNQEIYCKENELQDVAPRKWAKDILAYYNGNPKMIVTSRFHGAVLALSQHIPVIVTLEEYSFRFSWLEKYCGVYDIQHYSDINWEPKYNESFNSIQNLMHKIALNRIIEYGDYEKITFNQSIDAQRLDLYTNNSVLYYKECWKKITEKWNYDTCYEYAIWGVNKNADILVDMIQSQYPKAKLVDIYDMYKEFEYKGIKTHKPERMAKRKYDKNFYVLVTAYLVARIVKDMCDITNFPIERMVLCERKFYMNEKI